LPVALSTSDIAAKMQLHLIRPGQNWCIQGTSAVTGEGLTEGLQWLAQKIKEKKSK